MVFFLSISEVTFFGHHHSNYWFLELPEDMKLLLAETQTSPDNQVPSILFLTKCAVLNEHRFNFWQTFQDQDAKCDY